jgi:hypothetical protein
MTWKTLQKIIWKPGAFMFGCEDGGWGVLLRVGPYRVV